LGLENHCEPINLLAARTLKPNSIHHIYNARKEEKKEKRKEKEELNW
jgi:hypothetical protein